VEKWKRITMDTDIIASANNLRGYEILNLSNSDTISLIELVHGIEETLGKKTRIE
jgi:hypothetical protein